MKKKIWTHPKKKSEYVGHVIVTKYTEEVDRRFDLVPKNKGIATLSFESYQAAKKAGWKTK